MRLVVLLTVLLSACARFEAQGSFAGYGLLFSDHSSGSSLFELRVAVSGMSGSGLGLKSGDAQRTVDADGNYLLDRLASDASYQVQITRHPASPTNLCTVTDGTGVMPASGVVVSVSCTGSYYRVGGTLASLSSSLSIRDAVSGQSLTLSGTDASWSFPTPVSDGSTFAVEISAQPSSPAQACSLGGAGGTISGSDIASVAISCVTGELGGGGTILGPPAFSGTPTVTTVAGRAPPAETAGYLDATGTSSRFNGPDGITTDGTNLYIADYSNTRVRKMVIASGVVTTLFTPPAATTGITTNGNKIYLGVSGPDRIYSYTIATGSLTLLAGGNTGGGTTCSGINNASCKDGSGSAAQFQSVQGLSSNADYVFVADENNHRIRRVAIVTGMVDTLAGDGNTTVMDRPYGLTHQGTHLFATDRQNRIHRIEINSGSRSTIATAPASSYGIVTDGTNLYVSVLNRLYRYDSLNTGGAWTLIAGTASNGFVDGDALTAARLHGVSHITGDGSSLYFTDFFRHAIRKYH